MERYDPDLWTDELAFLSRPGQSDIQSDLFYDYRTNVDAYPKWQAWMREKQPRLLVIWGKYDLSFELSEPEAYRRDVPKAEVRVSMGAISRLIPQPIRPRSSSAASWGSAAVACEQLQDNGGGPARRARSRRLSARRLVHGKCQLGCGSSEGRGRPLFPAAARPSHSDGRDGRRWTRGSGPAAAKAGRVCASSNSKGRAAIPRTTSPRVSPRRWAIL